MSDWTNRKETVNANRRAKYAGVRKVSEVCENLPATECAKVCEKSEQSEQKIKPQDYDVTKMHTNGKWVKEGRMTVLVGAYSTNVTGILGKVN